MRAESGGGREREGQRGQNQEEEESVKDSEVERTSKARVGRCVRKIRWTER